MEHAYTAIEALIAAVVAIPIIGGMTWLIRRFVREEWTGKFIEDGHEYSEDVTIFRVGRRVVGNSRLMFVEDGKRLTARYRIRGALNHSILTAHFEGIDNREQGAFLLKYSFSQEGYNGKYLLIDHQDGISSVDYSWSPR